VQVGSNVVIISFCNMKEIIDSFWIYGVNPVREALRSSVPVRKVLLAEERSKALKELLELAFKRRVKVEFKTKEELSRFLSGVPHQGVSALIEGFPYCAPLDLLNREGDPLLLILDQIQDPRNLGALVRTAEGLGFWGVIVPKRRSAKISGAVAKASAGALFHIPIARVNNLSQTIRLLKEKGIKVIGGEANAQKTVFEADLRGPIALVIGGEEEGIRPLVQRNCDLIVSIPLKGKINSLNASVAGAILMYEIIRQRNQPLT